MHWRIYYGDCSTFSDKDGSPFDAPTINVQAVAQENAKGNPPVKVKTGVDAFCWREDFGWEQSDIMGMWDYLMSYKGPKAVLFGRLVRDKLFDEIRARALAEGLG